MLENAGAVVGSLLAELRAGHRTTLAVPAALKQFELWDEESLEQLLRVLHEYNRAGRLSDRDLDALCLMLERSSRSARDDDPDVTVEIEAPMPVPPGTAGRSTNQVALDRGSVLRGRYVLDEQIGSGGMSVVFRARDLRRDADDGGNDSRIAIKVLRPEMRASAPANARLKREYRQTQALQHPGIVRMFDLDCDDGTWFITMELLVGTTLEARLKKLPPAPIDTAEALRITSACADVLAFAHQHDVPHGDFKPGNVFLQPGATVKVLDFGTAPASSSAAVDVVTDDVCVRRAATRAYASPEVLAGESPQSRDDVFSLACVAYELLSGRHPFGRLPANRARDLALPVTALPQLSAAQNTALASGLAWNRTERPSSVQQFVRSLMTPAFESTAPPPAAQPKSSADSPRWRWVAISAAVVLALLIALWMSVAHDVADEESKVVDHAPAVSRPAPAVAALTLPVPTPGVSAVEVPPAPREIPPIVASAATPTLAEPVAKPRPTVQAAQADTTIALRERARIDADDTSIAVSEGSPVAVILLRRRSNFATTAQVDWRLSNGSARLQEDYGGPATGTTRFLPGQTSRAIYVPLLDDTLVEPRESFSLQLSSRSAAIGRGSEVTITVVDDD